VGGGQAGGWVCGKRPHHVLRDVECGDDSRDVRQGHAPSLHPALHHRLLAALLGDRRLGLCRGSSGSGAAARADSCAAASCAADGRRRACDRRRRWPPPPKHPRRTCARRRGSYPEHDGGEVSETTPRWRGVSLRRAARLPPYSISCPYTKYGCIFFQFSKLLSG
jgi:hypothetical protein